MGKKKKKRKINPPPKRELPPWAEKLQPPKDLTPEERVRAVDRLKRLLSGLSAPAEGVLEMLDRLGIPYNTGEDMGIEYIKIWRKDLEEGEKRNENLVKRIYKDNTEIVPREDIEVTKEHGRTIVEVQE